MTLVYSLIVNRALWNERHYINVRSLSLTVSALSEECMIYTMGEILASYVSQHLRTTSYVKDTE